MLFTQIDSTGAAYDATPLLCPKKRCGTEFLPSGAAARFTWQGVGEVRDGTGCVPFAQRRYLCLVAVGIPSGVRRNIAGFLSPPLPVWYRLVLFRHHKRGWWRVVMLY